MKAVCSQGSSATPRPHVATQAASSLLRSPGGEIELISNDAMHRVSEIKLIRTDTTLDLSQKAEKVWAWLDVLLAQVQVKLTARKDCGQPPSKNYPSHSTPSHSTVIVIMLLQCDALFCLLWVEWSWSEQLSLLIGMYRMIGIYPTPRIIPSYPHWFHRITAKSCVIERRVLWIAQPEENISFNLFDLLRIRVGSDIKS